MKPIDSTHFCQSCGSIAYRQMDESFWCMRCGQNVLVMSVPPEGYKVVFETINTDRTS